MWLRLITILATIVLLVGCAPRMNPGGTDTEAPEIRLTALGASGAPIFSSDEAPSMAESNCAEVRAFPSNVSVSADDNVGLDTIVINLFPGLASDVLVAPATADIDISSSGSSQTIIVTANPARGLVQPNMVITFNVSEFSGIRAATTDVNGNNRALYQVTLRDLQTGVGVICR